MDDTTRDPIIAAALDRYVPEAGWNGDWNGVVARSAPRSRRVWLMGAAVVAVAGTAFALLVGSSLRSESTAEPPAPPAATWSASLTAVVADDGRISLAPAVSSRIATGNDALRRCMTMQGVHVRIHGDGPLDFDDPDGRAGSNCRSAYDAVAAYGVSGEVKLALRSRARGQAELRNCVIQDMKKRVIITFDEPVDAPSATLRRCVIRSRAAAAIPDPEAATDSPAVPMGMSAVAKMDGTLLTDAQGDVVTVRVADTAKGQGPDLPADVAAVSTMDGILLRNTDGNVVVVPATEAVQSGAVSMADRNWQMTAAMKLQRDDACRRGIEEPLTVEGQFGSRAGASPLTQAEIDAVMKQKMDDAIAANGGRRTRSACRP